MNCHELKHALNATRFLFWQPPRSRRRGKRPLEEPDTTEFGSAAARNSHNYLDRSACRQGGLAKEDSLQGDLLFGRMSASFLLQAVQPLSRCLDSSSAHRWQSLMLQGMEPTRDADAVMHPHVLIERHCIIDAVTVSLHEAAPYGLTWLLLSVRCENEIPVNPLCTRVSILSDLCLGAEAVPPQSLRPLSVVLGKDPLCSQTLINRKVWYNLARCPSYTSLD